MADDIDPEILDHYDEGRERARLTSGAGRLELLRTQELLTRYLPPPLAIVLDVGGGPGVYAAWLGGLGYEVHLVDPVPLHVEQAQAAGAASATLGDARGLAWPPGSADAVLLLGPLYHLTEREDRIADPTKRDDILRAIRRVETEPTLLGASAHLLAVAEQ